MKKTRKRTTVSWPAASATFLPPSHTTSHIGFEAGAGAGAAGCDARFPVFATDSRSAAAFFISLIGAAGRRTTSCSERDTVFAASGMSSQIFCTSSLHDHAATPMSATSEVTTMPAASTRQRTTRVSPLTTGESALEMKSARKSGTKKGAPQ